MDGFDLMQFGSPCLQSKVSITESNGSPGNNPFDSLQKMTEDFLQETAQEQFITVASQCGRESVSFLGDFLTLKDVDFAGKESLGILKLESLSDSFNVDDYGDLNNAFVMSYGRTLSVQSSISASMFNSMSLEGSVLSKIYTVNNSTNYEYDNVLNTAFVSSIAGVRSKSLKGIEELSRGKQRMFSWPVTRMELEEVAEEAIQNGSDEEFNDSVFIEAHHLSAKIADGSIFLEQSLDNILDITSPPNFHEVAEATEDEEKATVETVFKAIDKMLPAHNDTKLSKTCSSSGSSKLHDTNELLHNLSEILNQEGRSSRQKHKGQQLLSSLANILCSDDGTCSNDNLEDSGHSSIDNDDPNQEAPCYEVLDLRTKSSKSNEGEEVMDLPLKSRVDPRLTQSFSFPPKTKLLKDMKLKSSNSLEANEPPRLKPKKVERMNKGPLKAIIPIRNMAKGLAKVVNMTPPKMETSLFKGRRTSTPISESILKPMAQSTPDGQKPVADNRPLSCSSQPKRKTFKWPVSPLSRPDFSNGSSQSNSTPNLLPSRSPKPGSSIPTPKAMQRHHSATELKVGKPMLLKRSYSVSKDLKTSSTEKRDSTKSSGKSEGVLKDRNRSNSFKAKPLSLLGRLRKAGKENKEC